MELAREMGRIAKAPEYVTIAAGRGLNVILTETLKGSEWIGKMEVVLKTPPGGGFELQ